MSDSTFQNNNPVELALNVHGELSALIRPASPDTIRASNFWNNRALQAIALIGSLGFIGIIWSALAGAEGEKIAGACAQAGASCPDTLSSILERISGAVLGSALYAFWTAKDYLREGTFNRQYSQVYLIRFGIGIIAGFILGSLITAIPELGDKAKQFAPLTIAIVGGFSAEAVVQILQRIADILVASVRGSDKERGKANAERAKADAESAATKKLSDVAVKLQKALAEVDETDGDRDAKIQKIIGDMLK